MQNVNGKYVPPPQRFAEVGEPYPNQYDNPPEQFQQQYPPADNYGQQRGGYSSRGGYQQRPRTVYNGDQFSQQLSYGGQGQGGFNQNSGYSQGNYSQGRQQNSFYDNRGSQSFGNNRGFGGGGGGYQPRGGFSRNDSQRGGGGYAIGPKVNALGFHGDERPDPRLEDELFRKGDGQTAGINFNKYDDIPVDVSDGCPPPYNEFTEDTMGLQLYRNLCLCNYTRPTPVQKYSIPIGLMGADLMACAQTGSGKTGGFLFPVIATLLRKGALPDPESRRGKCSYPSALVLAPTRELASQIWDEAQKFTYCSGIRVVVIYGGASVPEQQRELDRGADILIATPGRLVDFIERGRVKLESIQFLVLDEADRMLDMGFEPQIRRIVQEEGMPIQRQTFMFSATFPIEIQRLAGDFLTEYIFVAVGSVGAPSRDVIQRVEWVEQNDKVNFVIDYLNRTLEGLILVFVETKRGADQLEEILYHNKIPAASIHGDKSQREREDALKSFKSGKTPVLVATDVAARGLDIPNVTNVINFDLPSNLDDYIHRIGRTGRVGNVGYAVSLFNEKNSNIGRELAESLINNEQECPEWLEKRFYQPGGGGRGGGGRGRGGGKGRFGAKDYRKDSGRGGGGYAARNNSNPPPVPAESWSSGGSQSAAPSRFSGAGGNQAPTSFKPTNNAFPPLSSGPAATSIPYAPPTRPNHADNSDW